MIPASETIISAIASIQLEALLSLQKEKHIDKTLAKYLLQVHSHDIRIYKQQLNKYIEVYQQLKEHPYLISLLNEYQLLVCCHILYNMEEYWIQDNQKGVFETWRDFDNCLKKFHPEFSIVDESINKTRRELKN